MNLGLFYFYVCATSALLGAVFTVIAKNPIRGAMGLMLTVLSVAGLFLALHAEFLAAIQLIVYAGAIVVLFLFVIMLLGPGAVAEHDSRGRFSRIVGGAAFSLTGLFAIYLAARPVWNKATPLASTPNTFGSVEAVGTALFSEWLAPFELSSALLMVAILGAIAVAKGKSRATEAAGGRS